MNTTGITVTIGGAVALAIVAAVAAYLRKRK